MPSALGFVVQCVIIYISVDVIYISVVSRPVVGALGHSIAPRDTLRPMALWLSRNTKTYLVMKNKC